MGVRAGSQAMKQCGGLWLPNHEQHLVAYIEGSPKIDGKGTYQLHKLEMALAHVGQRRVALDIGAHVGTWSRILAARFDRVEAFEPMPDHCDCFRRNVLADNVALHEVALGARAGEAKLRLTSGNSGHTHIAPDGQLAVEMHTLDEYAFDEVDFVKIDCEGYEHDVLMGGLETLRRCRPVLIVEQKPNNGRRYGHGDHGALDLLKRMGARVVAQKAGDYVLTWC